MKSADNAVQRERWNKAKIVGHKAPFKLKDIWALRVRHPDGTSCARIRALQSGIDGKLRGCDLVALKVRDVCHGDQVAARAIVMQHKTQRGPCSSRSQQRPETPCRHGSSRLG